MPCDSCSRSVHRCCSGPPCDCSRCASPGGLASKPAEKHRIHIEDTNGNFVMYIGDKALREETTSAICRDLNIVFYQFGIKMVAKHEPYEEL